MKKPADNSSAPKRVSDTNSAGEADRDKIAKRLARIAGHASSLQRLWEQGYECKEVLTQIAAVRSALDQVGRVVLEHHIDHCVGEAVQRGDADEAVQDLKGALDFL